MAQATAGAGGASSIEIKVDPSPLTPQHQKQMTTSRSSADVSQGGIQEEVGGNHQEDDDKDELSEVVSRLTAESEAAAAAVASGVGTGLTTDSISYCLLSVLV